MKPGWCAGERRPAHGSYAVTCTAAGSMPGRRSCPGCHAHPGCDPVALRRGNRRCCDALCPRRECDPFFGKENGRGLSRERQHQLAHGKMPATVRIDRDEGLGIVSTWRPSDESNHDAQAAGSK